MKLYCKDKIDIGYLVVAILVLLGGIASAVTETTSNTDAYWYPVSNFALAYRYNGTDSLPELDELMELDIVLSKNQTGFIVSGEGSIKTNLQELSSTKEQFYHFTAIKSIQDQLVKYLNSKGIGGVVVMPSPGQIDLETMEDLRSQSDNKTLAIDIWVARVVSVGVNTVQGNINNETKSNSKYSRLLEKVENNSPISTDENSDPNSVSIDQLRTDKLEDYLFRLNRHPGRRVDVAIGPAGQQGDIALEYNIRMNKPWMAYAQVSNTGSRDTSDFRHRFGVVNNQLTGNDDIFNLDYLTTDFNRVNSIASSYSRPWQDSQTARYRLWLNWSDYVSSEIGSVSYFSGGETTFGFELSDNIYQKGRLFVDLFAGIRLSRYKIKNYIIDDAVIQASESFLVPQLGYRLEYDSGIKRTFGEIALEGNLSQSDSRAMQDFGRLSPDAGWVKLSWDLSHSFYLEPLWDPEGWRDITTPKSSTLAHELAFTTRGQWSPNRLIPQEKFGVGGLYSVRGYRQGYTSGDSVIFLGGEYRYHIPRAFDISKPAVLPIFGSKFRWAPEQVYGFPDWDLIFRMFIDSAMVINNNSRANEDNYYLSSVGAGLEFQLNRNFSLRCDWGVALQEETNNNGDKTDIGDSTIHISGMLTY